MHLRKQFATVSLGAFCGVMLTSSVWAVAATTPWFAESATEFATGNDGSWNDTAQVVDGKIVATADSGATFTPVAMAGKAAEIVMTVAFESPNDEDVDSNLLAGAQTGFRLASGTSEGTYKFQAWSPAADKWVDLTVAVTPELNKSYMVTMCFDYTANKVSFKIDGVAADEEITTAKSAVESVAFVGEGGPTSVAGKDAAVATVDAARFDDLAKAAEAAGSTKTITVPSGAPAVTTASYATMGTGKYKMKIGTGDVGEVGVIQVTKPSTTTILAVPFYDLAGSETKVTVATLAVSGIQKDDTLSVYDAAAKKYVNFSYNGSAWADAGNDPKIDPTAYTLTPGTAVRVESTSATGTIALVGKPVEEKSSTVAAGTVGLAVNMTTAPKKVSEVEVDGATQKVRLYMPKAGGLAQFAKTSDGWVKPTTETKTIGGQEYQVQFDKAVENSDIVPAGTGYWVENASDADVTVK